MSHRCIPRPVFHRGMWRSLSRFVVPAVSMAPLSAMAGASPVPLFQDGFEASCGALLYVESFDTDASVWPLPWLELADSAEVADVVAGEARLRPVPSGNPYPLARMAADVSTTDVDVRFRLRMDDASRNGVGFYVRQNGGHMLNTVPHGSGYAVFVEGTFTGRPGVGLWREEDGIETLFAHSDTSPVPAVAPQSGVDYEVRYQVRQVDAATTALRARVWPSGDAEPVAWHVEATSTQFDLQGISGGIAIDSWDSNPGSITPAHTFVDNIEVRELCEVF